MFKLILSFLLSLGTNLQALTPMFPVDGGDESIAEPGFSGEEGQENDLDTVESPGFVYSEMNPGATGDVNEPIIPPSPPQPPLPPLPPVPDPDLEPL